MKSNEHAEEPVSEVPAEVRLGSVLVSLLEPDRGREVEFNRWYERDHFYSGCMVGPHFFAGRRFVATRALKEQRLPAHDALFEDVRDGSYLALYWLLAGHHDEAERWAVDRVRSLIANDRMMSGRRPVHAGFYHHRFTVERDLDGVPAELALDHPYAGVGLTFLQATDLQATDEESLGDLLRALEVHLLPELLEGSCASLCLALTPTPLPDDAPSYVERPEGLARRVLLVNFYSGDPGPGHRVFATRLARLVEGGALGRLEWAAPFIPTIPGTNCYADELW